MTKTDCSNICITINTNENSECCATGAHDGCEGTCNCAGTYANMMGDIRLLPYHSLKLPTGWHFCNGDRYGITSEEGTALNNLSNNYKTNWTIITVENCGICTINVPNLFHSDGRGMFLRAVDSTTRQVGSIEGDAIRNIIGAFYPGVHGTDHGGSTGAFYMAVTSNRVVNSPNAPGYNYGFNASNVVPTATDNHPLNAGMTPAIYLGV